MRPTYRIMNRLLQRCEEVAVEPGMSSTVTNVYNDVLKANAETYRSAFDTIAVMGSVARQEKTTARWSLKELEGPYKAARSSVLARMPSKVLPETLSMQPTDTDVLYAIKTLTSEIKGHVGKPWADDLLSGPFGIWSTKASEALSASITANKAIAKATEERSSVFEPAYIGYGAFKRVVRDTLGRNSKQYRRIHLRSRAGGAKEIEEEGDTATGAGPAKGEARDAKEAKGTTTDTAKETKGVATDAAKGIATDATKDAKGVATDAAKGIATDATKDAKGIATDAAKDTATDAAMSAAKDAVKDAAAPMSGRAHSEAEARAGATA